MYAERGRETTEWAAETGEKGRNRREMGCFCYLGVKLCDPFDKGTPLFD